MLRPRPPLAFWSFLALLLGLALGVMGHASDARGYDLVASATRPLGDLWLSALQLVLIPLIVSQLLSAIAGSAGGPGAEVGRLGSRVLLLVVTMLLVAGGITAAVSRPLAAALYPPGPAGVASIQSGLNVLDRERILRDSGEDSPIRLPTNLVEAARKGEILPVLIFSAVLGVAVTRLPRELREPLTGLLKGFAEAMLIVARWILLGTPVGVFVLSYSSALRSGAEAAGIMGAFVILVCVLLAFFTLLLYPVTALAGRTSLRTFAKAAWPAQLVAISSLSSIAALPALVQGGIDHLKLPARFTAFVLPLCVAIFKQNRTISATAKLMFLAHVYAVPVSGGTLAVFLVSVVLISFSAVGVPNGGHVFSALPAYLAAGIPIDGVVILEATSIVPDMLKTVLNVTADMSVATILSRSARSRVPEAADTGRGWAGQRLATGPDSIALETTRSSAPGAHG